MWGHPMLVLGALCSFLEPFCGNLSPKIDEVSEKLTLRYHHEGPCVVYHHHRHYYYIGHGRELSGAVRGATAPEEPGTKAGTGSA